MLELNWDFAVKVEVAGARRGALLQDLTADLNKEDGEDRAVRRRILREAIAAARDGLLVCGGNQFESWVWMFVADGPSQGVVWFEVTRG